MINLRTVLDVTTGKLSKGEFLNSNGVVEDEIPKIVAGHLQEALQLKRAELVDVAMLLGFLFNAFPENIVDFLCQLIIQDWHHKHEDMAILLQRLKPSKAVNCLYKASELRLKYLDYDDSYQFARKCIKALSAIGNEEAIQRLKDLSKSKTLQIAEYAKKELGYKGLL